MTVERRAGRPIRKDEVDLGERGIHVESWLPERRSRRKPLFLIHGELCGSWLWERYLGYFAGRGWEGHAVNLGGHYLSSTLDLAEQDIPSYLGDASAGVARLPFATVIGHGMGALLALKLAEQQPISGLVLISPALPGELREPPKPHLLREVPDIFRRDLIGWHMSPQHLRRQHPDLSAADAMRVRHMMGAESGRARRGLIEGVAVDREALGDIPRLVIGGGLDAQYPEADSQRLAEWLGAEYKAFEGHSHFGLVAGEESHFPVADAIRGFLEVHKL
jgi:pimeloyl-ACP methyl ester carboxylesterase